MAGPAFVGCRMTGQNENTRADDIADADRWIRLQRRKRAVRLSGTSPCVTSD